MLLTGTMTGLAVDARLCPGGRVGVGYQVIVGFKLAHMAAVTGSIEGVRPLLPVNRLISCLTGEVPYPA